MWVDEFDLSNDTGSASIVGGPAPLNVTGIDKLGFERIGGLRDGSITLSDVYFNDAAGASHTALKALPTTDTIVSYLQGTAVGDAPASEIAKQLDFPGQRSADGAFIFDMEAAANTLGVVWGLAGTPGQVVDTGTGQEATIDNAATSANGLRAFLHVTAFTGTDATVTINDSTDDFSGDDDVIATFTSITGVIAESITMTGTVQRYLRVAISVDNFTSMTWGVTVARL